MNTTPAHIRSTTRIKVSNPEPIPSLVAALNGLATPGAMITHTTIAPSPAGGVDVTAHMICRDLPARQAMWDLIETAAPAAVTAHDTLTAYLNTL